MCNLIATTPFPDTPPAISPEAQAVLAQSQFATNLYLPEISPEMWPPAFYLFGLAAAQQSLYAQAENLRFTPSPSVPPKPPKPPCIKPWTHRELILD